MMEQCSEVFIDIAFVADILYLGYWVMLNIKKYMPWVVYLHFFIGSAIELILNWTHIIPMDVGEYYGNGWSQLSYIFLLLLHVILIGFTNLVLWFIYKIRNKNQV